MNKTKYESYLLGTLPRGCSLCVKGEKSVLFVTGLCSQNCYYCSLSDNKKNKDAVIINEWETKNEKDILEELRLCSSKGVGITGGDPLLVINKTAYLIRLLKKNFGKKFHIHLYTPLKLVNHERLGKLFESGLDEIRFHPDLDSKKHWPRIELARQYKWDVGVEIPALPHKEKQTEKLVDYICGKADFLNINELELSDNNFQSFEGLGFSPKDKTSYAIKGSLEMGKKIAGYAYKKGIKNVHFCTATLKDRYQLRQRILLRSKKTKKPYDHATDEGMLVRGAIYYGNQDAKKAISWLKQKFNVPKKLIHDDKERKRILTRIDVVERLKKELKARKLNPAIVEEYPTHDCFPVEVDYL